jgi:hypothetical protein
MATIPNQASLDIASLVNLFTGKSGTTSQSSNISKEGMDALVRQILESDRGIASIVGGQNRAGLYNTTTNQQLVGDFVARTAGELEAKRAGTTTTTRNDPTIDPMRAAIGVGAASLLGPTISRGLESVGVSGGIGGVGRSIADLIFGPAGGAINVDPTGSAVGTIPLPDILRGQAGYDYTEDPMAVVEPVEIPSDAFPEEDYSWLFGDDGGDIWGD